MKLSQPDSATFFDRRALHFLTVVYTVRLLSDCRLERFFLFDQGVPLFLDGWLWYFFKGVKSRLWIEQIFDV